jgi:hypothetical protein
MIIENRKVIDISDAPYFSSYFKNTAHIVLNDEDLNEWTDRIKNILNQPKSLNFGKVVHTGSLSNIPRFKLKEFIISNKLKRTSRQEQCDTMIIDKDIFQRMLNLLNSMKKINVILPETDDKETLDFLDYLHKKHINSYQSKEFAKQTPTNTLFVIRDYNDVSNKNIINYIKPNMQPLYYDCIYRDQTLVKSFLLLDFLKSHPNINIIFDEHVLELLNDDGIDLDDDYIDVLENMFRSNQSDNIKLAIEMLSNVNLKNNSLTIALLLNKYHDKFTHGSGITPSSMSSFKTIDKYYKSQGIIWKTEWRIFANGLYKKYSSNPEQKLIVEKFILSNINELLNKCDFKISSFDLEFKK